MSTNKKILLAALGLLVLLGGVLMLPKVLSSKPVITYHVTDDGMPSAEDLARAEKITKAIAKPVHWEKLHAAEKKIEDFCERLEAVTLPNDVEKTVAMGKGKDCIIFWGPNTGTSTLIHALCHGSNTIQLYGMDRLKATRSIASNRKELFKINHFRNRHSHTEPYIEGVELGDKVLYECPDLAFGAYEGEYHERNLTNAEKLLINQTALGKIFQQAKSLHLCYLNIASDIDYGCGRPFVYFTKKSPVLLRLFKDFKPSTCLPKIQLIITKGRRYDSNYLLDAAHDHLVRLFPNEEEAISKVLDNVILVDPMDRYVGSGSKSKHQITVKELRDNLMQKDSASCFTPDVFEERPISVPIQEHLDHLFGNFYVWHNPLRAIHTASDVKAMFDDILNFFGRLKKYTISEIKSASSYWEKEYRAISNDHKEFYKRQ